MVYAFAPHLTFLQTKKRRLISRLKISLPAPPSASLQWIRFPLGQRQQGEKLFMGERLAFCRPCTSMMRPSSVITTFMSVSAQSLQRIPDRKPLRRSQSRQNCGYHPFHRVGFQLAVFHQLRSASASATQAPVIEAVRVPPQPEARRSPA